MMRWMIGGLMAVTVACGPSSISDGETDDVVDGPDYEVDPHVDTYVPEGYRPVAPTRVIYLGDSITAGVGASDESLRYTSLLAEDSSSDWSDWADYDLETLFGPLEVVDVSVPGATTTSLKNDQLPDLTTQIGDVASGETVVVITIGGNDMQRAMLPMLRASDKDAAYEKEIGPVIENLGIIADYFQDSVRFPDGAKLFVTNVYEPTDGQGQAGTCFFGVDIRTVLPYLERANREMRELGEERGFSVVDLRGHFKGHGHRHDKTDMEPYDAADPTLWLDPDCIHPNDRGHHEIRRLFITAIDGRPLEAFGEAPR